MEAAALGRDLSATLEDVRGGLSPEREEETMEPQEEVKVSPGSVRQEVTQAISSKRGTLIILKQESEDQGDPDGTYMEIDKVDPDGTYMEIDGAIQCLAEAAKVDSLNRFEEKEALNSLDEDEASKKEAPTNCMEDEKIEAPVSPKEVQTNGMEIIKSPQKAKASWLPEAMETTAVIEVIHGSYEEVKELKMAEDELDKAQTDQTKLSLTTTHSVTESSATSLAVVPYEYPPTIAAPTSPPPPPFLHLPSSTYPPSAPQPV